MGSFLHINVTCDYFRTCSIFVDYPKLFDLKDIREFKLVYRRINCHNIYCKEGKKKKKHIKESKILQIFFPLNFGNQNKDIILILFILWFFSMPT